MKMKNHKLYLSKERLKIDLEGYITRKIKSLDKSDEFKNKKLSELNDNLIIGYNIKYEGSDVCSFTIVKKTKNKKIKLLNRYYFNKNDIIDKFELNKKIFYIIHFDNVREFKSDDDMDKQIFELYKELYNIDKELFIKKLKKLKMEMKIHEYSNQYENSKQILNSLDFYKVMVSNKKTVIKKRDKHENAIRIACNHYDVDESILKSLLGCMSNWVK